MACVSHGMEKKIQTLIHTLDPNLSIGVEVQRLSNGEVLFAYNSQKPFVTASTQKILPAVVALAASKDPMLIPGLSLSFGDAPFLTEVFYDDIKDETYFVFGGDPLLNIKNLEHILQSAQQRGLMGKTLYVVMHNQKDKPFLPPVSSGCPYEGLDFCYGGILLPAIINQNRVTFNFSGKSDAGKADVVLEEGQPTFAIQNMTHVQEACFKDPEVGEWDQVQRADLDFDGKTIMVRGCVPKTFEAKMCLPVHPYAMRAYIEAFMVEALKRCHIKVKIKFLDEVKDTKRFKKFSYSSSTLEKLLKLSLKDSNNLVTEALFSKLTQRASWPRNWDFAGRVLKAHIEKIFGVVFSKDDVIANGSGLSFYNTLTPATLTHILRKAYLKFGQSFADLLSQAGVDGTLENRLKNLSPCSRVSGKTGQLHGISNFAGYLQKTGKEPYVVSIFLTGNGSSTKERQKLVDDLLLMLLEEM